MATKKNTKSTSKNTSKKTTTSKTKNEVKEVKKKNELATGFVEEKKKPVKKEKIESKEVKEIPEEKVIEKPKVKKHRFVHFFLIILLLVSLGYFGINVLDKDNSIYDLIGDLLLTLFTVLFVTISISYHRKSKGTILVGGLLLLCYFLLNLNSHVNLVSSPISTVDNFLKV